ncbi:hypothetical protein DWB79_10715 [Treponema medium]|uniref:GerMN domain-containing protein n=2 Tax=Treponema medium TaxID=58231 RepID=A0AA87NNR4_TREMD|nr:GerMN domain-containing protein [Treponema medium]EPF27980.1 hypothetical protein HMPREF9195_02111 [Treponema medium ATCC 700293]QSH98212.1 hypothetical protein DWB79_10715 [Treponema medium]
MAKRTKRKISLGCLFWIVFILLIAVLFFLNKDTISFVLDKTNARSIFLKDKVETPQESSQALPEIQSKEESGDSTPIKGDGSKEPEQETNSEPAKPQQSSGKQSAESQKPEASNTRTNEQIKKPQSENNSRVNSQQNSGQTTVPSSTTSKPVEERTAPQRSTATAAQQPQATSSSAQKPNATTPAKSETDKSQPAAVRKAVIYWVRVDADGKLVPKSAIRLLPKSDAPMSDALEALFAAPTVDELKQGVRTLIPPDTKLRSAWVRDGVAFINVSEEFQFNQYGIDGALAQLLQVVFTATEFSTVKSVQFLIEGQKKEYLGAEGVWIGTPLSRTSF